MGLALKIICVALGTVFACGRTARGDQEIAFGFNFQGELGNGTTINRTYSSALGLANNVSAVAAGAYSVALVDGGIYAWGTGQLTPVVPTGLSSGVTLIASAYAVQNGVLYNWAIPPVRPASFQPIVMQGIPQGVTAVSPGVHAMAIQAGNLYAWGDNGSGELGDGSTTYHGNPELISNISNVTAIGAGYTHSVAVAGAALYTWGSNAHGELGDGTSNQRNIPTIVTSLSSGVTAIAAGDYHSLAVQAGHVFSWGSNNAGQLGNGTLTDSNTPVEVDPTHVNNIIAVAAGKLESYALSADGTIWDWGDGSKGQLGDVPETGTGSLREVPVHLLPPSGFYFTSIQATPFDDYAIAMIAPVPEPGLTTYAATILGFTGIRHRKRILRTPALILD